MARSRACSSIATISHSHKICSFVTNYRLAVVGCQDIWQLFRHILLGERPSTPHNARVCLLILGLSSGDASATLPAGFGHSQAIWASTQAAAAHESPAHG